MPNLSIDERKILEGRYIEGYRYIARDKYDDLSVYMVEPIKFKEIWKTRGNYHTFSLITENNNKYFSFINWEDDEPYEIEKLLEAEK
jgi:hypothetical protein